VGSRWVGDIDPFDGAMHVIVMAGLQQTFDHQREKWIVTEAQAAIHPQANATDGLGSFTGGIGPATLTTFDQTFVGQSGQDAPNVLAANAVTFGEFTLAGQFETGNGSGESMDGLVGLFAC
jgi:hypothetical protein